METWEEQAYSRIGTEGLDEFGRLARAEGEVGAVQSQVAGRPEVDDGVSLGFVD